LEQSRGEFLLESRSETEAAGRSRVGLFEERLQVTRFRDELGQSEVAAMAKIGIVEASVQTQHDALQRRYLDELHAVQNAVGAGELGDAERAALQLRIRQLTSDEQRIAAEKEDLLSRYGSIVTAEQRLSAQFDEAIHR
jgi:hypothetical protein